MIGFLITGHGNFATGLLSAIEVVAGEQEYFGGVDFLKSYSTEDLKEKLSRAVSEIRKGCDEIIIFTDLKGGTPFNVSVMLKMEDVDAKIEVVCGTNFPMLLSGVFEREGKTALELAQNMVKSGLESVDYFAVPNNEEKTDEDEPDEGI